MQLLPSCMSETKCMEPFPEKTLRISTLLLKMYSRESLQVVGELDVCVQYEQQMQDLISTVVAGDVPSLPGGNWLQQYINNDLTTLVPKQYFIVSIYIVNQVNAKAHKWLHDFLALLGLSHADRFSSASQTELETD